MSNAVLDHATREWTAAELRLLLPAERDDVLSTAADLAVDDYVHDYNLTSFEAFGTEDLHGRSSNSQPR